MIGYALMLIPQKPLLWESSDGRLLRPCDFSDRHLVNAILLCERRFYETLGAVRLHPMYADLRAEHAERIARVTTDRRKRTLRRAELDVALIKVATDAACQTYSDR